MNFQFIGILLALASATSWGGGDFAGGLATRKVSQFQVLFLASLSNLTLTLCCTVIWNEGLPSTRNAILALLAGIFGAFGLAALYKGLSKSHSAMIAPVAGVIGAIIPMAIGMISDGVPQAGQLLGFGLALIGILLVTLTDNLPKDKSNQNLGLAIIAGIGFGGFLSLIALVRGNQIFSPLVVAKLTAIVFASLLLWRMKQSFPHPMQSPIALLSGVLDAGGNILYLLATQFARLDVVASLSSLYPAGTVLLSTIILKERISPKQSMGVLICLAAIILITQ